MQDRTESGTDQEITHFRKDLFHDLRAELGHLKTCQTTLLVFTSAGAGIFFSMLRQDSYIPPEYLLLLPLVFLLPLWIIFYDKARTIARIVGFLRVQEKLYMYRSDLGVVGWESAMKKYWERRTIWDNRVFDPIFGKKETHRYTSSTPLASSSITSATTSIYWFTVFSTFFTLNIVCLLMGAYFMPNHPFEKAGLAIAIIPVIVLAFLILKFQNIGSKKQGHKGGEQSGGNSSPPGTPVIPDRPWDGPGTEAGSRPPQAQEKKPKDHTNVATFSQKALFIATIYVCIAMGCYFLSYGIIARIDPAHLAEVQIFSYTIFVIFFAAFMYCGSIATWMFLHLVKDRYSYGTFEKRWQLILNIEIDENAGTVRRRYWDAELPSKESPATWDYQNSSSIISPEQPGRPTLRGFLKWLTENRDPDL